MSRTEERATERFRLNRAGVLNVWQYDEQVFDFGGGRLLLRGANGAGKSKTLELLLPFCLDGDRQRMNASGRAQTALTWLMFDGVDDKVRTGYVWVEFSRTGESGEPEFITCGVGLRAARGSGSVTSWMFCTPQRIGAELAIEDADGPVGRSALSTAVSPDGRVFEVARDYRAHVGQLLFGLDPGRYDDLLRLLYWLRQPQIGEEIDPKRIAEQLVQSLPELDPGELSKAGSTLDELADFGEKLRRTQAAQSAVASALEVYARYAQGVLRERAATLVEADEGRRRLERAARQLDHERTQLLAVLTQLEDDVREAGTIARATRAELDALAVSPEEARLDDARARAEAGESAVARQEVATHRAERALDDAEQARSAARAHAMDMARRLDSDVDAIAALAAGTTVALPSGFAGTGSGASLVEQPDPGDVVRAQRWVDAHGAALDLLSRSVAVATSAAAEVRHGAVEHTRLGAAADVAAHRADDASARADDLRATVGERRETAATIAGGWRDAVTQWAESPHGLALASVVAVRDLDVDQLLDDWWGDDLPARVTAESSDAVAALRQAERDHHVERVAAARTAADTRAALAAAQAEPDPAPPAPALPRARERGPAPAGAPLWRSVDFAEDVDDVTRAAIEAALQQSGLLDAWVDADGALRDARVLDVLAHATAPVGGPTLGTVLRPADGARRVVGLLDSIALLDDAHRAPEGVAAIGRDGSFRLGPLEGRAGKPVAQYVGAVARAAERARRIGELTARLSEQEDTAARLADLETAARRAVADLEGWVRSVPPVRDLVRARDRWEDARRALVAGEAQARAAEEAAAAARSRAAESLERLRALAAQHRMPTTVDALDLLREGLRDLDGQLRRHRDAVGALVARVRDSVDAASRRTEADAAADEARGLLQQVQDEAAAQRQAYRSLALALSETLGELTTRRDRVRTANEAAEARKTELGPRINVAREQAAVLAERHQQAQEQAADQRRSQAAAAVQMSQLRHVPGLLPAALGPVDDTVDRVLAATDPDPDRSPVRPDLTAVAARWSVLPTGHAIPDTNALLRLHGELASGAAASHEPVLTTVHGAYALVARDGAADVTLAELAAVLGERASQQSQLLTRREREAFEQVLLGSLGDELRRRLQEAHELVDGMNTVLHDVRTSQGVRVRLRWRIREDTPDEARDVTELVARSTVALLPDERDRLHRAMSQLLELAADDAPDEGYAEHLRRALDYRTWHEFRVQYTRPDWDEWQDLSRRSPLSQGEQKVACYLPLFAAAAAHFTSVAGAAPHAPRFVLLDDAFPKIDARTHPLLFGLLVQLDLDFVVTSERLWGDHPEVPSLAIYEALRNPGEPGIAQAHYTWDGRALQAVGLA